MNVRKSAKSITIFRILKNEYGPQHWWLAKTPFEVIVGAILTQNTAWTNVERAIQNLRSSRLLSIARMSRRSLPVLARHLRPTGYFNVKARRLKNFLTFLNLKYGGRLKTLFHQSLPALREELLSVNGIGPETADSIILYAAEKPIFVVDAYTRRVFSRIGVFKSHVSYAHIQAYFTDRLPLSAELFNEFHALIVEHAKRVCAAKPKCSLCCLRPHCLYGKRLASQC